MIKIRLILFFLVLSSSIWSCKEGFDNPMAEATRNNGSNRNFVYSDSGFAVAVPSQTYLGNPYPNPLDRSKNGNLNISYAIDHLKAVNLAIENVVGDVVCILVNENQSAGAYVVSWDPRKTDIGIYIVHLTTSTGDSQKILIEIRD